ncbi:hypothetical protein PGTUg99_028547 [Puccinia graminis f. sp. tritici]|uniref:Uncharacterized protein n=1 Tax=Puccinia graminis f. sp. tritici TaxID=56615 RepID=A0A5B0RVU7_PUCGR|nr:hypothetical protein PGTUg99_028547 [Puccinia graminis f. sp. tritici]
MDSNKQHHSDLNELENLGQLNRTLRTGQSSAEDVDHSFAKSQEQISIGEKPIAEALAVDNDNTSGRSQKDTRTGKQPRQWWPSLAKWNKSESTNRYKRRVVHSC